MEKVGLTLASLAARPPTPPKENGGHRTKMAMDSIQPLRCALNSLLNTPEESPSSSAEYFDGSVEKVRKRVGFSPWMEYHKPFSNTGLGGGFSDQIRILPPSRDCRSLKSILKPNPNTRSSTPMENLMNLGADGDISCMLEATIQHLESPVRSSRLDAYSTLLGCLSAYDNVPEQQDLASKLIDLVRFLRRDIWAKHGDNGKPDTQLVTQALKLLLYLVAIPSFSDSLPDEFCAMVLEESISTLENQTMPKIMITHYMHLLGQENFPSHHLTNHRVNRVLAALGRITNIIKGSRIVGQRLMVYRRLLLQSKSAMMVHAESWVDHLISGMLSTFKEIRARAISLGNEASLSLGTIKSVSQTFADTLNRESQDGKKAVDFLATRLTAMASVGDEGLWVPQIWSIVILFLRGQRYQLEKWEHLGTWLIVIQKCFNSSNAKIKNQANYAWNRLIYAVSLDSSTSAVMVKMLRQPILRQLERKHGQMGSQTAKSLKQVSRLTYCTLLYYAFRPAATYAQLDHFWDEYIRQMVTTNPSRNKDDVNYFCQILASLLNVTEPKVWDENRAISSRPIRVDELPCLDPKWVRLRAADILKVFDFLLHIADWKSGNDVEAPIILAWRSFANAIRQASSKEIKTSMETMTALSHILNTIKSLLQQGLNQRSLHGIVPAIQKFDWLIGEAVSQLGYIPFNEKRLARATLGSYEVAETPSSRAGKHRGPLNTPVFVLLELLMRSIDYLEVEDLGDSVQKLIDVATRSATSRPAQLAVLRDLASIASSGDSGDIRTSLWVWRLLAEATIRAFRSEKLCDPLVDSPQYLGHEYRDAVKILESAIPLGPQKAIREWTDLGTRIAQALRNEVGSDAVILMLTEPVAKAMTSQAHQPERNGFMLSVGCFLLQNSQWPQSQSSVDRARKLLWGVGLINPKATLLNPFDHLYTMTNFLLKASYVNFDRELSPQIGSILSAVVVLVATCPVSIVTTLLKSVQEGVAQWIEDPHALWTQPIASKESADSLDVGVAVTNLWGTTITAIERLPKVDSGLLSTLEILIGSSLRSRHKAILNHSITLWNATFGTVDGLEYPDTLRPILLRLRTLVDLELPCFVEHDDTEMASPINFLDSQIVEDIQVPQHRSLSRPASCIGSHEKSNCGGSRLSPSNPKQSTSSSAKDQEVKKTPKARLRHDDSQIQFMAIDSSPLQPNEVESQLLTNRQNEVRQRQILEATTIFPNIGRVSPSTGYAPTEAMPVVNFIENEVPSSSIAMTDLARSPMDQMLQDVIGSSPTPRYRGERLRRQPIAQPSPFSAPILPVVSYHDVCVPFGSDASNELQAMTTGNDGDEDVSEPKMSRCDNVNDPVEAKPMDQSLETFEAFPSQPCMPNRKLVSANGSLVEGVDAVSLSNSEVSVDAQPDPPQLFDNITDPPVPPIIQAPCSPTLALTGSEDVIMDSTIQEPSTPMRPNKMHDTAEDFSVSMPTGKISQVIDSFQETGISHPPNEDDQITAQLAIDLQRASSQAENETQRNLPGSASPPIQIKKRKGAPGGSDGRGGRKKSRIQPPRKAQSFCIVVESRRAGTADPRPIDIDTNNLPSRRSPIATRRNGARSLPPRSSGRDGRKRHAGSSSSSTSSDHSLGETSDFSPFSPVDVHGKLSDHSPVGRRRRSARLHRFSPAPSPALHDSDAASRGLGDEPPAAVLAEVPVPTDEAMVDIHSTPWPRAGDAGPAPHAIPSSDVAVPASLPAVHGLPPPEEGVGLAPREQSRGIHADPLAKAPTLVPDEDRPRADPGEVDGAREGVGARGILRSLRQLLENIKRVALGAEEEREMVSVLVDSVREVHEAGRRWGHSAR